MRAAGEEANPQCVESTERKRHVAAGVEAHALTDPLRRRGSDGITKARRREAGVDDDRVAAFGLLELGAYGTGTEALGECERCVVLAGVVDTRGAQGDGGLRRIEGDALEAVAHDEHLGPG